MDGLIAKKRVKPAARCIWLHPSTWLPRQGRGLRVSVRVIRPTWDTDYPFRSPLFPSRRRRKEGDWSHRVGSDSCGASTGGGGRGGMIRCADFFYHTYVCWRGLDILVYIVQTKERGIIYTWYTVDLSQQTSSAVCAGILYINAYTAAVAVGPQPHSTSSLTSNVGVEPARHHTRRAFISDPPHLPPSS